MRNDNFEDLKVGDVVLVEKSMYGTPQLYLTKIIKRTKTRLSTMERGRERTWTNDGCQYPRPSGYGPRASLVRATTDQVEVYKRHFAIRKIKTASYRLTEMLGRKTGLDKFTLAQLEELCQILMIYTDEVEDEE